MTIRPTITDIFDFDNRAIEIAAAYERIEELTKALNGVLGLIFLLSSRPDLSPCLREIFNCNHRIAAAQDALDNRVAS